MRTRICHIGCFVLLGFLLFPGRAFGQVNEAGLYPIYNFTPKEYGKQPQNWCAVQDQRGIMYFGNNSGILEYDGAHWTLVSPATAKPVYSLAVDSPGRIYFGSNNEFGYLIPDSVGNMEYFLLSGLLSEEDQDFGEIWKTHVFEDGIVFQAYHHLFIWQDGSLHVIHSEEEINDSYLVGDRIYLSFYDSNLAYLKDGEIIGINEGEIVSSSFIKGMHQAGENRILIVTGVDGFYEMKYAKGNPAEAEFNRVRSRNELLFPNRDIYNMETLGPNRISLGTWGYGAIIIDTLFNLIAVFDKEEGLQDQVIQGQYLDKAGNLWLAMSKGISRIEVNSPITQFNDANGLEGTVQTITRFADRIYATTNVGLFYMEQKKYDPLCQFTKPAFQMFPEFDYECWDMIVYSNGEDEVLLVLTNDEVYEITENHQARVILNEYPYKLYQSAKEPRRVLIGLESGIKSIYRQGDDWIDEGQIAGVDELISDIYEDKDDLWLGTLSQGVLLLQDLSFRRPESPFISRYGKAHGLPEGPFVISEHDDRILVATNKGLYRIDEKDESFLPDSVFGEKFSNGLNWIHRIRKYSNQAVFMVTMSEANGSEVYDAGYTRKEEGSYRWINEPFSKPSDNVVHAVFIEDKGEVWLGGPEGIYRYLADSSKDYRKDFYAYVRKVESEGEIIFGGAYPDDRDISTLLQPNSAIIELPYRKNDLVFTYSAQANEDESFTEYSYFLEGNDKKWSKWTSIEEQPRTVYTNLHEGRYIFHVKAKNIYGHISTDSSYEFSILAPWFRTIVAYIIYGVLAVLVVYLIVTVYTRRLRAIIRERTAEVVAQKEVIEEKNNELMDSILYAEKIQRAMIPPEDDLSKMKLDGFIFFRPLNIVSGDFYWLDQKDKKLITVAADCTGHGVPGAFMSMLGVAFLNNIVEAKGITRAADILNELRAEVISALKQKGESGEQKDGMDLALHVIDFEKMKMEYAGANNPLIMIRDGELTQYKADRMPIGIHEHADRAFENQEIDLRRGDVFYTFSDGFPDQFGGPKNKKFMTKRLKELFLEIHHKPMQQQKEILEKTFYDWTVPYGAEQIDDVIVIGLRIP